MFGSAGGSDDGGMACKFEDETLGGALDEGAFLLARDLGEGELGANGSEGRTVASTFALDFLGLAG